MVAEKGTWLKMKEHKTFKQHGYAVKPVPPGNWAAFEKVLEIHPADAKRFLDPPKLGTAASTWQCHGSVMAVAWQ